MANLLEQLPGLVSDLVELPVRARGRLLLWELLMLKQTYCIEYLSVGWNVSFLKDFLETCVLVQGSGQVERAVCGERK